MKVRNPKYKWAFKSQRAKKTLQIFELYWFLTQTHTYRVWVHVYPNVFVVFIETSHFFFTCIASDFVIFFMVDSVFTKLIQWRLNSVTLNISIFTLIVPIVASLLFYIECVLSITNTHSIAHFLTSFYRARGDYQNKKSNSTNTLLRTAPVKLYLWPADSTLKKNLVLLHSWWSEVLRWVWEAVQGFHLSTH